MWTQLCTRAYRFPRQNSGNVDCCKFVTSHKQIVELTYCCRCNTNSTTWPIFDQCSTYVETRYLVFTSKMFEKHQRKSDILGRDARPASLLKVSLLQRCFSGISLVSAGCLVCPWVEHWSGWVSGTPCGFGQGLMWGVFRVLYGDWVWGGGGGLWLGQLGNEVLGADGSRTGLRNSMRWKLFLTL